jgi:AcrR family transcriptional regulator
VADLALTPRGEETRRRLLEAAIAELVERDGALEVASVAGRAGVSVGLLYRYFGSKAGLVAAVVDDFYDRLLEAISVAGALKGVDWATRERRRTELSVAFHYREPLAPVLLGRLAREPEVAAREVRRIERLVEDAALNVERGQRRGEIPAETDARMVGAMLIGGYRVAMAEALTRPKRPSQRDLTEVIWRFVVHGVGFQSGPRAAPDGAGRGG